MGNDSGKLQEVGNSENEQKCLKTSSDLFEQAADCLSKCCRKTARLDLDMTHLEAVFARETDCNIGTSSTLASCQFYLFPKDKICTKRNRFD